VDGVHGLRATSRPLDTESLKQSHAREEDAMDKLTYTVARGQAAGTVLTPHLHSDGNFVVSKTRFEKDYIRVKNESDLPNWLAQGYSIRMSNPEVVGYPASLIAPKSIRIEQA
jgi:hypothetical protein